MERKDNTAWIVIKMPNGDTRVIEASEYAVVTSIKDPGEAIRVARENFISIDKEGCHE